MITIEDLKKIRIFMGGMGFYISTLMAKQVSMLGGLGIVSGVAPEIILPTILQRGDANGDCRRALSHFPFPKIAQMVIDAYYIEPGNPKGLARRTIPFTTVDSTNPDGEINMASALSICGNFVFVWLAKEGHNHPVGVNLLEKITMPLPSAIIGAMLAHVDLTVVGAGIPDQVSDVIDAIYDWRIVSYRIPVGGKMKNYTVIFDLCKLLGERPSQLEKPLFMPIVSSNVLAWALHKKLKDRIAGFIVEGPTAGGHNAPPRNKKIDLSGEPIYDENDVVNCEKLKALGLPFWLAGSYGSPQGLAKAMELGANGIQVGSAFALCEESGLKASIRKVSKRLAFRGELVIKSNPYASSTGYPFQTVEYPGSLSELEVYGSITRFCKYGVLREPYERPDGSLGYRCPAEPIDKYLLKGGRIEDTVLVRCLCQGLVEASILGEGNYPPIVTLGKDAPRIAQTLMTNEDDIIMVEKVFNYILGPNR